MCKRMHLEHYLIWLLVGLALLGAVGCAATPIRLGPGDCVVLAERDQVIVAGSGCQMQRLYR